MMTTEQRINSINEFAQTTLNPCITFEVRYAMLQQLDIMIKELENEIGRKLVYDYTTATWH